MNSTLKRFSTRRVSVALFLFLILSSIAHPARSWADTMSPRKYQFFLSLYKELHGGELPSEGAIANPEKWLVMEQVRLEPIVVAILEGKKESIPWDYALVFAAPLMPTPSVCNAVYAQMTERFSRKLAGQDALTEQEHALLVDIVTVLAAGEDTRALPPLNFLIETLAESSHSHISARKLLRASEKIGDESTLDAVRQMRVRRTNERINKDAALTERMIIARVKGERVTPDAYNEIIVLSKHLIQAVKDRDRDEYLACFPSGNKDFNKGDFEQMLNEKDIRSSLTSLESALSLDPPIKVGDNGVTAVLALESIEFQFIYEIDGWKVANFRRITENEPTEHK